ncbi:hypothetical protein ABZ154_15345 [Streptomyces sp. NPDC006261]|uniref:hypothetical protein n=1 Tax=Streptomyces sp. NPDC006261 TaxID=3156739 RepID=UPI0033BD5F1A
MASTTIHWKCPCGASADHRCPLNWPPSTPQGPTATRLTERPNRPMHADGPELIAATATHLHVLRQVGWIGQTGALYSLDENPLEDGHEGGGVAPLYFPAHTDRLDDLAPDDTTEGAR